MILSGCLGCEFLSSDSFIPTWPSGCLLTWKVQSHTRILYRLKWSEVQVTQSCPTLCNPMDCTVHGIFQARILEWVALPFSRGSSQPRDWTRVSCTAGAFLPAEPQLGLEKYLFSVLYELITPGLLSPYNWMVKLARHPGMQSQVGLRKHHYKKKTSGGDGSPVELFKILKDDAVKVLHSICRQIWKTQQWPQDWKSSVFIPIPKKGNAKECSNYCTITFISHTSKVMLKTLQVRFQ